MSEITLIEPQKKDKTRCNVYVDGKFYCGVKFEVAVKYHLKNGLQIEKERLDEIQLETEKSQALDKALCYLSASMKTERQIKDYLAKKGYVAAVIDYCMEKLHYYGYVDDAQFCSQYIKSVSGKGKRVIAMQLKKRGVAQDVIENALDEVEEDESEVMRLLQKYMRGKVCDKANLYKGYKYLISKGYDFDVAKQTVDKFNDENDNI